MVYHTHEVQVVVSA